MSVIFENAQLALYLNLVKYLEYKKIPYRITKGIVTIENDTILFKIEDREKYAVLVISDTIMEDSWTVTIDMVTYSLPTPSERSPFATDIDYYLKIIQDNRVDKREAIFNRLVIRFGLEPKYENIPNHFGVFRIEEGEPIYSDPTSTLYATRLKDPNDLSILVVFKERTHETNMVVSTTRMRLETVVTLIDDISATLEGYR